MAQRRKVIASVAQWTAVITTPFKRGYKHAASWLREKADGAINEIVNSENPLKLGRLKRGRIGGCYGYDLSGSCRILYALDHANAEIHFLRMCSHEEVYR